MTTGPNPFTTEHVELSAAAGDGYRCEWALFCDYTAATDQPNLPTSIDALLGFLRDLPAAPATTARRVRAIAAAHRRTGHLLARPGTGPAAALTQGDRPERPDDCGVLVAACPTRGWPDGLWGRRDAFLIVLLEHLKLSPAQARELTPSDIDETDGQNGAARLSVRGTPVSTSTDTRECPACAVIRWLDVLGDADGLGRGSARGGLSAAQSPTADSPHRHHTARPPRWRGAAQLLPAIDRHGWHDDYRSMSLRTIRSRRAAARARVDQGPVNVATTDELSETDSASYGQRVVRPPGPRDPKQDLDEVLGVLDEVAHDADELNARIAALLDS